MLGLYIREITETDYKCQEKKEEDSPALKIAWIHQYEILKISLKNSKEILITTTRIDNIRTNRKRTNS